MFDVKDYDYRKLMNDNLKGELKSNANIVDLLANSMNQSYTPVEAKRTSIDRLFDAISATNYVSAGIARGLVRDDMTVMEGIKGGFRAANPFGDGYEKGEHTYSQVLDDMGWQPTSTGGKIARGIVGFVGDVMLDPATYLSGGATALVKGTGEAGVKATHKLAGGLTKEAAESIITKQALERGTKLTADEISKNAEKFTKEYNRLIGIREGADDVTISLANAPFGKKLFGDLADKKATLIKGETLQNISEKTRIAPQYAKLRDKVYGSKMGKLFSSKSTLYELSKTQPEAVYDFMKFAEYTRGFKGDLQAQKKAIYDKAKSLNLTPEETKQVITMMEDKSIWGQVKKMVDFSSTKEAQIYKQSIKDSYDATHKKIDELNEAKKHIETLKYAKDNELFENNDALEALRGEYADALANIDMTKINDENSWNSIIKSLEDEIENVRKEEIEFKQSQIMTDNTPDNLIKNFDAYRQVKEIKNTPEVNIKQPNDASKNLSTRINNQVNTKGYVGYKSEISAKNFAKNYPDWNHLIVDGEHRFEPPKGSVIKKHDQSLADKEVVTKELSNYLFGRPDKISLIASDDDIGKVVDMIRKGTPDEEVMQYVEQHADRFSGKAKEMYNFIAEQIGYKDWKSYYTDKMSGEKGLIQKSREGKLTPQEKKEFAKLQQDKLKRDMWIKRLDNMSIKEITDMRTEIANQKMWDDLKDIDQYAYRTDRFASTKPIKSIDEQRRDRMIIEDSSAKDLKTNEFTDNNMVGKSSMFKYDKFELQQAIMEKMFYSNPKIKPEDINGAHLRWADSVINEASYLLNDFFKKDYANLSPKQKDLLIDKSIQSYNSKIMNGKSASGINKDSIKEALTESIKRSEQLRIDTLKGKAKEGSTVVFKTKDGEEIQGVVKSLDDEKSLSVLRDDGSIDKVDFSSLTKVNTNAKLLSAEEIIQSSKVANDFAVRYEDLTEQINFAKDKIKNLDSKYQDTINKISDDFANHEKVFKDNIKGLEQTVQNLNDEMSKILGGVDEATGEITGIDSLFAEAQMYEKALESDDAFETYMRATLGDGNVDNIISRNSPYVTKLILDPKMNVSDKVADIVRELRKDLLNIGESEIRIDKLKEEQFVKMMYDYLPHILTDEGKKLFESSDEIVKKFPGFGDALGYGRKFNPFGKSRTIKKLPDGKGGWIENPNVLQINDFFKREFADVLNGKNVFSEDIADIYLTRALKNTELLYDNKYMKSMMDDFGSELKVGESVKDGYKAVANYGVLREFVRERARELANLELEQMKSLGVKPVGGEFKQAFEKHIGKTLAEMGLPKQALDELGTPMIELTNEQITKIQNIRPDMIKQVNEAIVTKANQSRKLQIAKDQSRFLQIYDKFTHFIKLNQTTVLPAFHARNKIANTFNNWLAVGSDAVNIDFQKKAFQAIMKDGEVDGVLKITKSDGSIDSIEWSELYRLAKEFDVIDDGFFAKDIGVGATSEGLFKKLPAGLDPTDTKNFKPYKKGAEIGGKIENQDKLIHFASQMSRGMNVEDAAESVKKYLFDYSDLTAFEQNVMRRVLPYYTWLRKNSALQLDRMLADPKKYMYVAKVVHGIEGMVNDEDKIDKAYVNDFAKDWVQTPFNVTNPEGRLEPVLWNPNLPYMDLGRIPDPTNISGSLTELFAQTNPLIKTPIEQIINRNVFFDAPIVEPGDASIPKRADHVLSQLSPYTVAKGFATKGGADLALHTLNSTSGIKMLSYDYEKYKAMKIQELLKKEEDKKK